jgi:hypothetical protein
MLAVPRSLSLCCALLSVKDDWCGHCGNDSNIADYRRTQDAINAANSSMVLTIEGAPNITQVYQGGHGNARRVGHDIKANWLSMTSLIDIGSGLWPYAHNGSKSTSGTESFWNDLDSE